jgi:hypothetical protein
MQTKICIKGVLQRKMSKQEGEEKLKNLGGNGASENGESTCRKT